MNATKRLLSVNQGQYRSLNCKIISDSDCKSCNAPTPAPCDCNKPLCDQDDSCNEECEPCDCTKPLCDQPDRCGDECPEEKDEEICKWSNWSPFCECSASCDEGTVNNINKLFSITCTGTKRRTRNCYCGPDFDEPESDLPQPGCEGPSVDEQPCGNGPCGKLNSHAEPLNIRMLSRLYTGRLGRVVTLRLRNGATCQDT